ncbi:MAG TPA: response regulator [Candidatus Saccharibacteria bacterium]|nr:response regulator [Candidatus Saccharibacteria bacterium]
MKDIKVALIEDDAAIVDMYVTRFNLTGGFNVQVANDGVKGLRLINTFGPDIILLDMMMPRMSGLETLARLRKLPHGEDYKVIALTNMKDVDTVHKIKLLHVSDYLVKAEHPPGEIVERIYKIVGTHPLDLKQENNI